MWAIVAANYSTSLVVDVLRRFPRSFFSTHPLVVYLDSRGKAGGHGLFQAPGGGRPDEEWGRSGSSGGAADDTGVCVRINVVSVVVFCFVFLWSPQNHRVRSK